METKITKPQTALIAATAALLIFGGFVLFRNMTFKDQLQKEKIRSETLLSEKLNLEKSIEKTKKDISVLQGKNSQMDKIVKETNENLIKKESQVKKLMAENASLADIKKKNAELEALRAKLEEDLRGLNLNMEKLLAESRQSSQDLESVKSKNALLSEHNAILEAMLADNYRVEALKGRNDKLTVVARRTDKLLVSFELPSDVGNELSFKILTPGGEEISSVDNISAKTTFLNTDKNYIASLGGITSGDKNTRRAELVYEPDNKLSRGVYRFSVYNGKDYVGSTQVRLK